MVNNVKVSITCFGIPLAGVDITGHDDNGGGSSSNFLIQNNVWDDINSNWGGTDDGFSHQRCEQRDYRPQYGL